MDIWERSLHAGLVGDAEAEVSDRKGKDTIGGEEEDKVIAQRYHSIVL